MTVHRLAREAPAMRTSMIDIRQPLALPSYLLVVYLEIVNYLAAEPLLHHLQMASLGRQLMVNLRPHRGVARRESSVRISRSHLPP